MNASEAARSEQQRVVDRCRHPAGGFVPLVLERPEHLLRHLERRADSLGARLALAKNGETLTYRELHERADRLARAILQCSNRGPEPVALLLDNGPDAVVAMLGVWKAGKFFVMLDATAPVARLAAILADSGTRLLVAAPPHTARAHAAIDSTVVALLDPRDAEPFPAGPLGFEPELGALACLVYTSGTTGRPKGVMVGYACLAQRIAVALNRSRTCGHDREAIVRSSAFIGDIGVIFNALAAGASAHFFDVRASGLAGLRDFLRAEAITILSPGVSLFRQLVTTLGAGDTFPTLRLIRLAGEQVLADDVRLVQQHFSPECVVRIGYSSTETGPIADFLADRFTPLESAAAPCGYPSPGVELSITDGEGRAVAVNESGEIVVRSPFLARGYWKRPDEMAIRFLPDPEGGDRRRFRTGDLGKLLANGMLEVVGRVDAQVKVRGHRVEPAEVEAALLAQPGIRAVAVGAREDKGGHSWLTAYVVVKAPTPSLQALRDALAARLPAYMVPQRVVAVDAIPVTPNGKVDWRALPPAASARPDLVTPYVAPRGPIEVLVAAIWQDILGVDGIGAHDTFLDLAGDSLGAARIVAKLQQRLSLDDSVQAPLVAAPTVEAMAAVLVQRLLDHAGTEAVTALLDEIGQG
jgi:amino acid adenylation domain-containing protein